jgi:hypothetical protein
MSKKAVLIEIYDPPMCCPSGLCGPSIDPALLDIQEAVLKAQQQFNGQARIERYLLSQQPARFMQNPSILSLIKKEGTGVLPVTTVDGEIRKLKTYPTLDELRQWIEPVRSPHA